MVKKNEMPCTSTLIYETWVSQNFVISFPVLAFLLCCLVMSFFSCCFAVSDLCEEIRNTDVLFE